MKFCLSGFVALLGIIIVGSVGVVIAISLLWFGVESSRTSFVLQQSVQAKSFANACAEEALNRVRDDEFFVGGGNFSFDDGVCNYFVQNQGGSNRLITVDGIVGVVVRKIKIVIDVIVPQINVSFWGEVGDF